MNTHVAKQLGRNRIRVAMIVTGFPNSDDPAGGIFNLRAAKALSHSVDVEVVRLRAWKPGRKAVEFSSSEGIPVITVTAPQLPESTRLNIISNIIVYRHVGWSRLSTFLQTCHLIHSVGADFPGVLASSWANWAGVHHVTQVIGDLNSVLRPMSRSYAIAGWEKCVHGVACNSSALAKSFLELYPKSKNVRTVWRGVDLERYHPSGAVGGPLADNSPVRHLYLGGFPAYASLPHGSNTKGGKTLLAAWQAAEKDLWTTASLLIAGPESNSGYVARWRAGLRFPERVHLEGYLRPELIPEYIRASDVVLIPSMEEGLPNVAVEASACGRPVFGSDVGGIPEVVVNGQTGLILPAGDVKAWKDALIAFANTPASLRTMGELARHRMEALFDSRNYVCRMLDLYRAALEEPLSQLNHRVAWKPSEAQLNAHDK